MSDNKLKIGGIFTIEQIRDGKVIDKWEEKNLVVDEGLNYVLNTAFTGGTAATNFYIGLFGGNYSPASTDTAATFPTAASEVISSATSTTSVSVSETVRQAWVPSTTTTKIVSNSSAGVFHFTTAGNVYGAFLVTSNVIGGTSGKLVAASRFTSTRVVAISDVLNITYTLQVSST